MAGTMPVARQTVTGLLARPVVLRWLGMFGALCCAGAGLLFGAPVWIRQGVSVLSILRGPHGPLIMLLWIAGLAALCAAWWHGRKLLGQGLLSPRWIIVTAGLWILPLLVIPPLASRDMYAYACQGALFDAGFNPSVVGISAQPCPWLDSVSVVWRDTPTPYGPLWIMLSGLAAALGSQAAALAIFRVYAVLGMIALAAVVPVLARRRGAPVDRALWLVLCCPIVAVHVVGGGHNDALTMALLLAGLALIAGRRASGGGVDGLPATASGRPAPVGLLIAGGALVGAAIAVKTTIGVVLPFAALLAAGGLQPGRDGWLRFLRRGGAVVGGALGGLLVLSTVSGLGLGWATALSGAGESRSWTSPSTAIGIAINAAAKWFGVHIDAVPATRLLALALMLVALVVLWWRFRRADPLHGAALACLVVICCAPITQPWYLFWALALLAVTTVRTRWLEIAVVASMFLILPNGDGAWKPLQVPFAFLVTALAGWAGLRVVRWLRAPVAGTP
jgi:alpha-1,6-mannosyltransferase